MCSSLWGWFPIGQLIFALISPTIIIQENFIRDAFFIKQIEIIIGAVKVLPWRLWLHGIVRDHDLHSATLNILGVEQQIFELSTLKSIILTTNFRHTGKPTPVQYAWGPAAFQNISVLSWVSADFSTSNPSVVVRHVCLVFLKKTGLRQPKTYQTLKEIINE